MITYLGYVRREQKKVLIFRLDTKHEKENMLSAKLSQTAILSYLSNKKQMNLKCDARA